MVGQRLPLQERQLITHLLYPKVLTALCRCKQAVEEHVPESKGRQVSNHQFRYTIPVFIAPRVGSPFAPLKLYKSWYGRPKTCGPAQMNRTSNSEASNQTKNTKEGRTKQGEAKQTHSLCSGPQASEPPAPRFRKPTAARSRRSLICTICTDFRRGCVRPGTCVSGTRPGTDADCCVVSCEGDKAGSRMFPVPSIYFSPLKKTKIFPVVIGSL